MEGNGDSLRSLVGDSQMVARAIEAMAKLVAIARSDRTSLPERPPPEKTLPQDFFG
jgi:hypothetical protein